MMNKEEYKCMCLAEEKSDLSYVIKKIGLKRKTEESKKLYSCIRKGNQSA